MSSSGIASELERFDQLSKAASSKVFCKALSPHVTVLSSDGQIPSEFALTISSLIHGNETVGIYIVNDLLSRIQSGAIRIRRPMAFMVGNREAALAGKRFLDRDLNRSFDRTNDDTREDKVCRMLEPTLAKSRYVVDLHQTIAPSLTPFFIYRYEKRTFEFSGKLADLPVVTFWGKPSSRDGKTLTEFVMDRGHTALTVEHGQMGFEERQFKMGVSICERAIGVANDTFTGTPYPPKLFKIGYTYVNAKREGNLNPGWRNFAAVASGQMMGTDGGNEIVAPISGKMLFPRYDEYAKASSELFSILEPILEKDLP